MASEQAAAGTAGLINRTYGIPTDLPGGAQGASYDPAADGLDLILSQTELQGQTAAIEVNIRNIQQNTNLSDTEKMFSMQMAMNSWSAITNLRTNMLKTVADTLKAIVRNVS